MNRGDVYWAELGPPIGRRPVVILTRDAAIPVLTTAVVAPVTRTIRGIATEVVLGASEGLDECVVSVETLLTVPKEVFDPAPAGRFDLRKRIALDRALRFALDIAY